MILASGDSKDFLGQEFLTWLWYYGEQNHWTIVFPNQEEIGYGLEDLLVMTPEDKENCSQRLKGTYPVGSPEAHASLEEGKRVSVTRMMICHKDREWLLTWKGDNFTFSSLQLVQPTTNHVQDRFLELSEDLDKAISLLDQMYYFFLQIRLSPIWQEKEVPAIQDWIHKRKETL